MPPPIVGPDSLETDALTAALWPRDETNSVDRRFTTLHGAGGGPVGRQPVDLRDLLRPAAPAAQKDRWPRPRSKIARKPTPPSRKPSAKPEAEAKPPTEAAIEAAPDKPAEPEQKPAQAATAQAVEPQWGTLGSGDADSPYRMLVTWNNRGASIERVELNSSRYHDLEKRSGYLGQLAPTDAPNKGGAVVHVVGPGTPAGRAGLKPGDVITAIGPTKIASADALIEALLETRPFDKIEIAIMRDGNGADADRRVGPPAAGGHSAGVDSTCRWTW